MIPSHEDFLSAACRWNGSHHGINYELSWHGRSDYQQQGIWCWYIILLEEQFYTDDWKRLRLEREDKQLFAGSWHRQWKYDDFPDIDPHGGWTFGELTTYLSRDGKEYERVKVGCDYAHLWDQESGYWQGRSDIESDVKRSINLLVQMFPRRRERCAYTGKYDDSEQFYTARNGARVLKSIVGKFSDDDGPTWLPASAEFAQ